MKNCVVTCTGGRPELFALCKEWVLRQTVSVDLWLVVTDNGDVPDSLPSIASHLHVNQVVGYAPNTDWVPNNTLQQALNSVPKAYNAFVFEDDDWYSSRHVEECLKMFHSGHQVAYCPEWIRYHVPSRTWNAKVRKVPGEGRVGLRYDVVEKYAASLTARPLYAGETDGRYYRRTVVGIKGVGYGLPGRAGASDMHKGLSLDKKIAKVNCDSSGNWLRSQIGSDADKYFALVNMK